MDAALAVLKSMQLRGGIFLEADFTAPWCIASQVVAADCRPFMPDPAHIIAYHFVAEGEVVLRVEGMPPTLVKSGEVIVLPRNEPHVIGSAADLPPVLADLLVEDGQNGGCARIVHGGGGDPARIYCGFLGSDIPAAPLCEILPPAIVVSLEQVQRGWIESSVRFAALQLSRGANAQETIGDIADLIFCEAVRTYLETIPAEERAWQSGLLDAVVARALVALHRQPARDWTAEELAGEAGLSRSAFVDRFTRRIGMPPMRYLGRLRLNQAARRLERTADPISQIAVSAGYDSEAAFTRAFKRTFGVPPAAWRRAHSAPLQGRNAG